MCLTFLFSFRSDIFNVAKTVADQFKQWNHNILKDGSSFVFT